VSPLRRRRTIRNLLKSLPISFCFVSWVSTHAIAQQPTTTEPRHSSFLEVRLALSESASAQLAQRRLRRYLSIELEEAGHLAAQGQGPLSDHVAYVWIDFPDAGNVTIQTRVGRGAVATRTFALREGLRPDVTARLVAIATSEMIRSQARPTRIRKPKEPKPLSPEQVELATRQHPALLFTGKGQVVWLPSVAGTVGGSGMETAFRLGLWKPFLSGSWLVGDSKGGPTRWVEAGLGADRSFFASPKLRWELGLGAYGATVHFRDGYFADGGRDTWAARVSGRFGAERVLTGSTWLGIAFEPAMLLRSAAFQASGTTGHIDGFSLGLGVFLQTERRLGPDIMTSVHR